MVTITVNERTKAGKALLEAARIMAQHSSGIDFNDADINQSPKIRTSTTSIMDEIEQSLTEIKAMKEGRKPKKMLSHLLNGK